MPIYEYRCTGCGHQLETIQRVSDPPLTTCESCGGSLEKLISAPAFQFKGSGWYVTDYARSGRKDGDAAEGTSTDAKKDGDAKKGDKAKTSDAAPTKSDSKTSSATTD